MAAAKSESCSGAPKSFPLEVNSTEIKLWYNWIHMVWKSDKNPLHHLDVRSLPHQTEGSLSPVFMTNKGRVKDGIKDGGYGICSVAGKKKGGKKRLKDLVTMN